MAEASSPPLKRTQSVNIIQGKSKQLHVKVYKYLQVQQETNETSQTSLYQCKKTKTIKNKQVGMKVHRHNPLCTLLYDIALVWSIVKAKIKLIFTVYL